MSDGSDPAAERWTEPLVVSVIQPELAYGDVDTNLERALSLISKSREEGPTDLFVLPEVFSTGFPYEELPVLAKRSDDVSGSLSDKASETGSHIMFTQVVEDKGIFYNRCIVISPAGRTVATYDKTHLFTRADEHRFFGQGSSTTHFEINGARVAPLICYELRFPELSRKLAVEGAHVLVYMGQWPLFRVFQWDALLLSRAIENQSYVAASGAYGKHGDQVMGGHSQLISPFGNILGRVDKGEGFARASLGPEELRKFRTRIPVLFERRPDLY